MVFASNAQLKMKRTGLGIHAGVNTTDAWNIVNNTAELHPYTDPLPGFQIGMRYNIKLGPIGFCPEINLSRISTGYIGIDLLAMDDFGFLYDTGIDYDRTTTLNYVSVPLLLKLYMGGFNIHVGGQVSALLGGTIDEKIYDPDGELSVSESITNDQYYYNDNWFFQEVDIAFIDATFLKYFSIVGTLESPLL